MRAVEAGRQSVEPVRTQYMTGRADFQNVPDTRRALFNQQDRLAASEGILVQNLVVLYWSLGSGRNPDALPVAESRLGEVTET